MKKRPGPNKRKSSQWLVMLAFMLIGAVCGVLMMEYVTASPSMPFENTALSLILLFALLYLLIFVHIAVHELGHLVFGLLSGYSFSSYRIGSLMFLQENKKLRVRFLSISGTGGQCLMIPPEGDAKSCPVLLYNLGGSLFNLIFALLPTLLCLLDIASFAQTVILMNAFIGAALGLVNGIPLKLGPVDNDGANALSLGKNPDAKRAFVLQLRINAGIAGGVRLKDMPDEWFELCADNSKTNVLSGSMNVFACNRLMDKCDIPAAEKAIESTLYGGAAILGLHRNLLVCDLILCRLIQKKEYLPLLTKEQKKFMKAMKSFPSVIRTEYAIACAGEKDIKKAQKIRAIFEKRAKSYPYPCEIQGERELMDMLQQV